ncbi:MAG TPA: hypothetical protein VGC44_05570 [Longimicrobiales bacterium]
MKRVPFVAVAAMMTAVVALFPILAGDSIAHLVGRRAQMEPGNFALILYLEVCRGLATAIALVAAIILLVRSSDRADARALTFFLLFFALAYQKVFGAIAYPGPLQEKLTMWLLGHGVSRPVLGWLFGPLPWAVWPALAAILRFSVVFPQPPLSAELIDSSGSHDRTGMMRGAGVAGADIGAVFRRLSKQLLAAGAYRVTPLWAAAVALVAVTTVLDRTARNALLLILAPVGIALVITNLRACFGVVREDAIPRMRRLGRGFLIAGALLLAASLPLLVSNNPGVTIPALMILMIATVIITVCLAAGALTMTRHPESRF